MLDAFVWYLDVPFYDQVTLYTLYKFLNSVKQRITLFLRIEMESIL